MSIGSFGTELGAIHLLFICIISSTYFAYLDPSHYSCIYIASSVLVLPVSVPLIVYRLELLSVD